MLQLDVVVLTFNEELNLSSCLRGIQALGAKVFVVDSGSTDATIEIARSFGCEVVLHPFSTHAEQWRWALSNLPLTAEWVLAIDADQELSPELADEIRRFVSSSERRFCGAYLCRRQVFRGRWIRFGGYYPKYLLKLFRRSDVRVGDDLVDHHFVVSGATTLLRGDMIEANRNEDQVSNWVAKHNRYAVLQARDELARRGAAAPGSFTGSPDERTAFLKRVWMRLPLYVRPVLYFVYRYVVRLGFLDGKEGFVFHFLQGFWYRLLVDINIEELTDRRQ